MYPLTGMRGNTRSFPSTSTHQARMPTNTSGKNVWMHKNVIKKWYVLSVKEKIGVLQAGERRTESFFIVFWCDRVRVGNLGQGPRHLKFLGEYDSIVSGGSWKAVKNNS